MVNYSKAMIAGSLALGLCLAGSPGQVRASADADLKEVANEAAVAVGDLLLEQLKTEWLPVPKASLLNCGDRDFLLSGAFYLPGPKNETLSAMGWFDVPAGDNSGSLPMPSDTFFIRIEAVEPSGDDDTPDDTKPVELPGLQTREFCARWPALDDLEDLDYFVSEEPDGKFFDREVGLAVPEGCGEDGYEMMPFYQIDASDLDEYDELGIQCDNDGCKIVKASEENPVPVGFRECPN